MTAPAPAFPLPAAVDTSLRTSFDLLTESWVPVRYLDGRASQLSLPDVFRRAHECREVIGELPTTAFALTRLLLAVLHRVYEIDPDSRGPAALWAGLWRESALPGDEIAAYLTDHAERFDLLHPSTPFLQVADLRSAKGEVKPLDVLVADVPSNEKHFTTRAGSGLERMGFDEAARWLVHVHAFDSSGIRTGAVGDPRVKNGKGYPIGVAWTGQLGGLLVTGADLKETLLLNLVLARDGGGHEPWPDHDQPVWERDPLLATEEDRHRGPGPTGPADLYTWPSRRVRLVHDGLAVTGVVLSNGDPLKPQNLHRVEPMTAWRRSGNQERQLKRTPVYMHHKHNPDRALWRGLPALLAEDLTAGQGRERDAPRYLRSLSFGWLAHLGAALVRGQPALDPRHPVSTRAVGIQYGSNESVVSEVVDDRLTLRVAVLADPQLRTMVADAVRQTDQAVHTALGQLARNLVVASGSGDPTSARNDAVEKAYFDLDARFRTWLRDLEPDASRSSELLAWYDIARGRLWRTGQALLDDASPSAWAGREVNGRRINAPLADLWFQRALWTALPGPAKDPESTASEPSTDSEEGTT